MIFQTFLATAAIFVFCFLGFGVGSLFFNRKPTKTVCGTPEREKTEPCPSQQAGICPIEDDSGALKLLRNNRLT